MSKSHTPLAGYYCAKLFMDFIIIIIYSIASNFKTISIFQPKGMAPHSQSGTDTGWDVEASGC